MRLNGTHVAVRASQPVILRVEGALMPAGNATPAPFQMQSVASGARRTLALTGEIDMLVAPELEEAIRHLCDEQASELVLDLRKVTFMDSTGLRATITAHQLCKQAGRGFAVVPAPGQVQSLFELTGLAELLPLQTDGEQWPLPQDGILPPLFASADGHGDEPDQRDLSGPIASEQ